MFRYRFLPGQRQMARDLSYGLVQLNGIVSEEHRSTGSPTGVAPQRLTLAS